MNSWRLEEYIQAHSSPPHEILHNLWRYTWLHTIYPRMAAGPQHGLLLQMICQMLKPAKVLELGTFTGYATLAMALATPESSMITSIEANEEHLLIAAHYVQKSSLQHKIKLIHGQAGHVLPTLTDTFDLIYLDADKISYPEYFSTLKNLLLPGGFLLADNVLWGGKVANPAALDRDTEALRKFNKIVHDDVDFVQLILPVHDGLMIAQKIN